MGKTYKVWVEIEELDSDGNTKCNGIAMGILPDCLGSFTGRQAKAFAIQRMADVTETFALPATKDTSDAIKACKKLMQGFCKRCGTVLKKNGKCKDVTCPFSDRLQHETFTEG